MTDQPPTPPTEDEATVDVKARLTQLAGGRTARPRKAAPARKSTARTVSRNESAARRGKYAKRITDGVEVVAKILAIKDPVRGAILIRQAQPFADALDKVAAEDKRVDAFLSKVSGLFGKGGAWSELATVSLATGGAMMFAGGNIPIGPAGLAIAFLCGDLIEQATTDAATRLVTAELEQAHGPVASWAPGVLAIRDQLVPQVAAGLRARPAADVPDVDQDQGDGGDQGDAVNGWPVEPTVLTGAGY